MTKNGKLIIVVLALAIAAAWFTRPGGGKAKPKTMRAPSAAEIMINKMGGGGGGTPKAKKQQPKKNKKVDDAAQEEAQIAAMDFSDFDLLREKLGRDDPFAPYYDISDLAGDTFNLPDLEPLPPMIIEGPRSMNLSAIGMKDGNGIAVINGEIKREGDELLGFTVHSITSDRVELVNDLKDKAILRLKPKPVTGFDVTPGSISNVKDETRTNSLIPTPPLDGPLQIPIDDEMYRNTRRQSYMEKSLDVKNSDPAGSILDQVDSILENARKELNR